MAYKAFHDLRSLIPFPTLSSTILHFSRSLQPHWPPWYSSNIPGTLRPYGLRTGSSLCLKISFPRFLLVRSFTSNQAFAHLSSFHGKLLGCQRKPLQFKFLLEVLMNAIWQEKGIKDIIIQKAGTKFSFICLGKCHYYIPNKSKKIYWETVGNNKNSGKRLVTNKYQN